jgi:hypothetical protein
VEFHISELPKDRICHGKIGNWHAGEDIFYKSAFLGVVKLFGKGMQIFKLE